MRIRYRIALKDGLQEVMGVGIGEVERGVYAFGLRYNRERRHWQLDHLATGMRIYYAHDKEEVIELAEQIFPLLDWPQISKATPLSVLRPMYETVRRFRQENE